jgi:hypothetical protein
MGSCLPSVSDLSEWLRFSSHLARDSVLVRSPPTPRRPLLVQATDQGPASRPRRNTTPLPARTPTGHLPEHPLTAHLPRANMRHLPALNIGHPPAPLDRAKARPTCGVCRMQQRGGSSPRFISRTSQGADAAPAWRAVNDRRRIAANIAKFAEGNA